MGATGLAASVGSMTGTVVRRVRESSSHFPVVRRKPRVALEWLLGARAAQMALLGLLVFSFFVLPRIREPIVSAIVPEEGFGDRVAGVFGGRSRADEIRDSSIKVINSVTWYGGAGVCLMLLLFHLPAAVARSAQRARAREQEADALRDSAPLESVLLYRSAIPLACDRGVEDTLHEKIRELEAGVAAARRADGNGANGAHSADPNAANAARPADPNATIAVPPAGAENGDNKTNADRASQHNLIAGRYEVENEIGRGANGIAYRGADVVLERPVALKRLSAQPSSDDAAAQRFEREARVLAQLNHPNIVQVYDLAAHDGSLWMVMELVEGGDMASYLDAVGTLPASRAADLAAQVARALGAAHERKVIHRDLKPANILMAGEDTPKVTDFGLAKLVGGSVHTVEGAIMGSPYYMSPEQAEGKAVGHHCDIYALGVILYRMIAGKVPFEGDFASVLAQHVRKPPKPLCKVCAAGEVPAALDRLVVSMLAKKPDDRPDTMAAVADSLARFAAPAPATR